MGGQKGPSATDPTRPLPARHPEKCLAPEQACTSWPDYVHEREVVAMAPETFARYAGEYEFERPRGMKMRIYAKGGRFYRGSFEMLPVSETLFVIPRAGDELEFVTDSTGRAVSFLYGQPGTQKTRARRIPAGK